MQMEVDCGNCWMREREREREKAKLDSKSNGGLPLRSYLN